MTVIKRETPPLSIVDMRGIFHAAKQPREVIDAVGILCLETGSVEKSRSSARIGLQYFGESRDSADSAELEALAAAEAELENALEHGRDTGDVNPQRLQQLSRLMAWRNKVMRDEQLGKPTTTRQYYKILRENGGGDLAAKVKQAFHPDVPAAPRSALPPLTLESLDNWLASRNILVRWNDVSHEMEVIGIDAEDLPVWCTASGLPTLLYSELQSIYRCSMDLITNYLNLLSARHAYNPVLEMLDNAPAWDGVNRYYGVFEVLHLDPAAQSFECSLVRKWLMSCIALQYNTLTEGFGMDGILVLEGDQGIGKTRFFEKLAVKKSLFKDGIQLDTRNKDSLIKGTSCWIAELGETDGIMQRSTASDLKAFLTSSSDEIRLPYGRAADNKPRRTAFCGTTNERGYLVDTTGNRRYWTVHISEKIDHEKLTEDFVLQLWKQVEADLKGEGLQSFRLTDDERKLLESSNLNHMQPLPAQDEILDIIEQSRVRPDLYEWRYATFSEFRNCFSAELQRYSVKKIAAAVSRIAKADTIICESTYRRIGDERSRGTFWYLPMFKGHATSTDEAIAEKVVLD